MQARVQLAGVGAAALLRARRAMLAALLPGAAAIVNREPRLCAWRFRRELGSRGVRWAASREDLRSAGPGARLLREQVKPD